MKIIYLNTWWATVADPLRSFIRQEADNADIFCLQEATEDVKQLCRQELEGYEEVSDNKALSEIHTFSQSIFFRKNVNVVSSGTLMTEDLDTGLAIYVKVKSQSNSMYICNVHGSAYPGDKLDTPGRLKQSSSIIDFFKEKNIPAVVGGDFNLDPHTKSVAMFEENGYKNLIKDFNIDTTRNHLAWDRYPKNRQPFSDYVFINNTIAYKNFSVPKIEVSDHLPLILEI